MPTPLRHTIKQELADLISNYTGSTYFADNYPTVNIQDFDIAGLSEPEYFPIVNIVSTMDEYPETDSIGVSDRNMSVIIDVIPFADEVNGFLETDKVLEEFPDVIYSDPRWSNNAIDTTILDGTILRLGTDIPTLKVRFTLNIKYRRPRPI